MKKTRNSSIELLRIFSMLSIVIVHYWHSLNSDYLITPSNPSFEVYKILKVIMNYGVNIFVIISGYFMVGRTEVNVRKVFNLVWEICFYGTVILLIALLLGTHTFSLTHFAKVEFPYICTTGKWFVRAYIIMYLFVPFLNRLIANISQKSFKTLLCILIALFSIWPFILPYPPMDDWGYSWNHFVLLYLIAAYLRLYVQKVSMKLLVVLFVFCTMINYFLEIANTDIPIISNMSAMVGAHNNPFSMIACFSLFLIFANYQWYSRVVNSVAATAFTVYVLHTDPTIGGWYWNGIFNGGAYQHGWVWLPHLVLTSITIYGICTVLSLLVKQTFERLWTPLFDRIRMINLLIKA